MIFYFCPDAEYIAGGVRHIYRHVDILNKSGFDAVVLHSNPGFRADWFPNDTRLAYVPEIKFDIDDWVVVPEVIGVDFLSAFPVRNFVIFNLNTYYTFTHYPIDAHLIRPPYLDARVKAIVTNSEDGRDYLRYCFRRNVHVLSPGISDVFSFQDQKLKQIAFMPRKNAEDAAQVINILKYRGLLEGWQLKLIQDVAEDEVPVIMKDTAIFLSFGAPEGYGSPPAEAIACGCMVVGYYGQGGREFMFTDLPCIKPIEVGHILDFVKAVEPAIEGFNAQGSEYLLEFRRNASQSILARYSMERETHEVISFWKKALGGELGDSVPELENNIASLLDEAEVPDRQTVLGYTTAESIRSSKPKNIEKSSKQDPVPVVVAVYDREDDTRSMLRQLAKVTDNYSLIIINNGFSDPHYLRMLKPAQYIKNKENTGVVRSINQGLEVAQGEYVAVLHHDLLIFDDGWLDHIIEFMERKPDVGLVGLAGCHSIRADGSLDIEHKVVKMRGFCPESRKPTWRFTEVATVDGLGWVMRNLGFRLDEGFGSMHFYDRDLSLQYIDAGYKVYAAAVDLFHLSEIDNRSSGDDDDYPKNVVDKVCYEEVGKMFRQKWQHLLPITRGFQDEAYAYHKINELQEENKYSREYSKGLEEYARGLKENFENQQRMTDEYVKRLEEDNRLKAEEIEKASKHIAKIEEIFQAK